MLLAYKIDDDGQMNIQKTEYRLESHVFLSGTQSKRFKLMSIFMQDIVHPYSVNTDYCQPC